MRGVRGTDARVAEIHALARAALEAGHLSEPTARAWLMSRDARLVRDRYFQHVFFDVYGMQLTYHKLRRLMH